jgi:hypothetical protein
LTVSSTVLLADSKRAASLAERLSPSDRSVAWYTSLDELIREQPLSSVSVLVLHSEQQPKGVMLALLGRMSVEYPGMQKLAVIEGTPPLPIAEYLTACGVALFLTEPKEERLDQLISVLNRMHEQTGWIAGTCQEEA